MTRSIITLGLAPAVAVGVVAVPLARASADDESVAECQFRLDESGRPRFSVPPPAAGAVQGCLPTVDGDAITFDLVAGDRLSVAPAGPAREFLGKRVVFDLEATIVQEHTRNCKKVEDRQPYAERGHERGPTLTLGRQVTLSVEIRYQQRPGPSHLLATFDRPVVVTLADSATVTVRLDYDRAEVEFAGRAITAGEQRLYVDPEVGRLRRERPTYRDVRSGNARVEPGDLGTLGVAIRASRGR